MDFDADPSHAVIVDLPLDDSDETDLVGDLIAECIADMHPVTSNNVRWLMMVGILDASK